MGTSAGSMQSEVQRPRGRPAADEPHTTVTSWIPVSHYDQLVRAANQRNQSVSSLVKQLLVLRLPQK